MHPEAETRDGGLPTSMLQRVVSNNKDAMNILFEAALQEGQNVPSTRPTQGQASQIPRNMGDSDTVQIWDVHRFVKMGWFTAKEAMTLVDLSVKPPYLLGTCSC